MWLRREGGAGGGGTIVAEEGGRGGGGAGEGGEGEDDCGWGGTKVFCGCSAASRIALQRQWILPHCSAAVPAVPTPRPAQKT